MASVERNDATRTGTPSSEGERAAVVGLGGQYQIAARIVLAKLSTLEWIRVADPAAGVADDFQFQAGPTRYALQVKWAQYPSSFGWAELVNPSQNQLPLVSRLTEAWQSLRGAWGGPLELHLRSNEHASTSTPRSGTPLAACTASSPRHFAAFLARSVAPVRDRLRSGRKQWIEVKDLDEVVEWQAAWDAVRGATGLDPDAFAAFISDLVIHFGPPTDDRLLRLDREAEEVDTAHLAATIQGLVEDRSRPVQLTRSELLARLGWSDRLRFRHPHAFPVPTIYTANAAARQRLQERLDNLSGGYVGLVAPAGSGKSTLLASLSWRDRRVVRYYAFVPDAPDPLSGRGEADSFLHDITLALDESGLPRQGYGRDLRSQRAILLEQLDQAGKRWRDHSESTVIIVDGLDHVPREQHPSRSLLDELPSPHALPDGVFIILGTQTTAIVPPPIRSALATDDRTVDLPPLSAVEVLDVADAAGVGAWLHPGQRQRLVETSEGHPLALTYLLQELSSLEAAESDTETRAAAADQVLTSASAYGREVQERYRGYLLAVRSQPDLLDLLATVARLRTVVDLDWLKTWVAPRVLDAFVERTSTFFRRDGTVWRFIHNSFRRFLVEETARVAGEFDAARDRELQVAVAEICAATPPEWSLYRDEELAHRYLAGHYDRVKDLATPQLLRAKLLELRPPAAIRDHALLALRAAAETDDHASYVRMLIFIGELWQREYVSDTDKLAEAMVKLGPPERALEHLVAGGHLRTSTATALNGAVRLVRRGDSEAASQILRAVGGLPDIVFNDRGTGGRDASAAVADWAEVTLALSGLDAVLAQLDDQLPYPVPVSDSALPEVPPSDDESMWTAARRRRQEDEHNETVVACRNRAMARCYDFLTDVRDDTSLARLLDRIDAEASGAWRARARIVHAIAALQDGDRDAVLESARDVLEIDSSVSEAIDDIDDEEAVSPGRRGVVPLHLRLRAADLLIDAGLSDGPEIVQLVPPGTTAMWPSTLSGQDGLEPFETTIDLWRLRKIQRSKHYETDQSTAHHAVSRKGGERRFRGALQLIAELEAHQLTATMGYGAAPNVVGESDPIIRLLEVPVEQTRDWTGWYFIRDAASGLFRRLIDLAKRGGPSRVVELLDRFADAWVSADRAQYWPPRLQLDVLRAILDTGYDDCTVVVRAHLERLGGEIAERTWEPHDRVETWFAQAEAWSLAGAYHEAEKALCAGIDASLGPGAHDDDRQLVEWLEWLRAAVDCGVVNHTELVAIARKYANRLVGAQDADRDAAEAAAELIELAWAAEPSVSTAFAESLCESGVIKEADAISSVLVGGARDNQVPVNLVAIAAAEMLIPLLREPPAKLRDAISGRDDATTPKALAVIADAVAVRCPPVDSHSDPRPDTTSEPVSDGDDPLHSRPSATAQSLLAAMRQVGVTDGQSDSAWASAVESVADEQITAPIARALLQQATRIRLGGEALGGIAAIAARAGVADSAVEALASAVARTPAYGWIHHHDAGSRLKTFGAALRHRHPALVRLAAQDLAGALAAGVVPGRISPEAVRRVAEMIGGREAVARAWPDVVDYLDVFAPTDDAGLSDSDESGLVSASAVEILLRWVSLYFGHPVRSLDFGARHLFHAALEARSSDAQRVLAEAVEDGGWRTEAALHTLVTYTQPLRQLSPELAEAIRGAAAAEDAISRDLTGRLARRYQLSGSQPPARRLPDAYRLVLPSLPDRAPPPLDREGVPYVDKHDPQQMVAPFDFPLRLIADEADLAVEAVVHRAASIVTTLRSPWIGGGHRAHADRLKMRGQRHGYRPWAYMAGRRALGIVLAELLDAGALGTPPAFPAYHLGLIDDVLIHVKPIPLNDSNPRPWRSPGTSAYDAREWCDETDEATRIYSDATSSAPTYVLAEDSEWCSLEWGKPEERRTIEATLNNEIPAGLIVSPRPAWESTYSPANSYPKLRDLDRAHEQLIVQGLEPHTDPQFFRWLALHPWVASRLGWRIDDDELFAWRGDDGGWRARTVRRLRGNISHQPPAKTYCAEVWQVILSDVGLVELRTKFGPVERHLIVERELPPQPREGRREPERASARTILTEPT